MTPALRRLVALAAALAPGRAAALLGRLDAGGEEAGALAARLAAAPRRARLAALAAALPLPVPPPRAGSHPLLARLAREPGRGRPSGPVAAPASGADGGADAGRTTVHPPAPRRRGPG